MSDVLIGIGRISADNRPIVRRRSHCLISASLVVTASQPSV